VPTRTNGSTKRVSSTPIGWRIENSFPLTGGLFPLAPDSPRSCRSRGKASYSSISDSEPSIKTVKKSFFGLHLLRDRMHISFLWFHMPNQSPTVAFCRKQHTRQSLAARFAFPYHSACALCGGRERPLRTAKCRTRAKCASPKGNGPRMNSCAS
jgi:hypothetical protein